jgi:gamma-glutamyltranspeptidase/glutathione hydrolase
VEELISMDYARRRAALIDPGRAAPAERPGDPRRAGSDTVVVEVIDAAGNIASLIQSVFKYFGSGVTVDRFGFALHNRASGFAADPKHPNALGPRKRPFHTIIPALMEKGGRQIGFGIMGALNQAQAHAQFVSNVADHGLNIQAALEAPRFTRLIFDAGETMVENRIAPAVRRELEARGHRLQVLGDYSSAVGGAQVVMRDPAGINYAGSDPRKDGAAVPEPHPYS